MSETVIVKENQNPEIKFLKVSVVCCCCRQVKEVELPLEGIMLRGAERDIESKVAKSQHGPDYGATQELLKEPRWSTARGLVAV